MTRQEFASIIAYLSAAVGKPIAEAEKERTLRLEVYFDLLGDLSVEVLKVAAQRVALSHKWATFPTPAEIREAAAETARGDAKALTAADAWTLARKVAARYDPEIQGEYISNGVRYPSHWAFVSKDLPPLVVKAMDSFGVLSLVYSDDPAGVVRGQFTKLFDQLNEAEKRHALLPANVRQAIDAIGQRSTLPAPVAQALPKIGVMDDAT